MLGIPAVRRFAKSLSVGFATFSFDLLLLFVFIDVFHLHYLFSAGIAFTIATTINYLISRHHVFVGSKREAYVGYALFLFIGGVGLVLITGLMYLFVDIFHFHYLISRILIAGVVGWWNYLMNLYVNFRVVGVHHD